MAHGHHHDTGLSWEWDSVLLLSHPHALAAHSLEADGSTSGREPLGSTTPASSLDHRHFHGDNRCSGHECSLNNNHIHTDSRTSPETQQQRKDSKGGDRRRDPRLDCPNFLAGRVPCACTDNDDDDSGVSRKRSKPIPRCQVAACGAELTDLKGYHQRHRVCLRCAHATRVILREQPHRYCQQCGKFHPICDFDEGKRSCRRKLEKHNNRRRRKAGDDGLPALDYGDTDTLNESSPGDGTKVDALSESEMKDSKGEKPSLDSEDTLQTPGITSEEKLSVIVKVSEAPGFPEKSEDVPLQTLEPSLATGVKENVPTIEETIHTEVCQHERPFVQEQSSSLPHQVAVTGECHQHSHHMHSMCPDDFSLDSNRHPGSGVQMRRENEEESLLALLMDENGATEGSQFSENNGEHLSSHPIPLWGSTSPRSLSKDVAYSSPLPTGRITFKLYDWNPGDFPRHLRQQVMEWLGNMPVDLEGYIRSGCTILTIFFAMPQSVWDELNADWAGSVLKLVRAEQSPSRFWNSGYLIARMDDHEVHINNGELARPFCRKLCESPILDRVRPLCLLSGSDEEVVILGRNFQQPESRLLVSFDGKYIVNDAYESRMQKNKEGAVTRVHHVDQGEDARLFVSMPALPSTSAGTAYIEVENISGTSNFIPVLVAEMDIVDEVRTLEKEMDKPTSSCCGCSCCNPNINGSPGFSHLSQRRIHNLLMDLGWVSMNINRRKVFESDFGVEVLELHLARLRTLLFFGVKRNWYKVVEKVLQLSNRLGLLDKVGTLESGLSALHVAVLYHNNMMVEHLMNCTESLLASGSQNMFWWNVGFPGAKGLTILHILALQPEAQGLCEMLLKIKGAASVWNHTQDQLGHTPQEYFTRKKKSYQSKIRYLSIHADENSKEGRSISSNDLLDVSCEGGCSRRLKAETRIPFPSLSYLPRLWKFSSRARVGVLRRRLPVPFRFFGQQGLTMYISGRKRSYHLLSSVVLLLVWAGLCVTMPSLRLQQSLFCLGVGSQ